MLSKRYLININELRCASELNNHLVCLKTKDKINSFCKRKSLNARIDFTELSGTTNLYLNIFN